MATPQSKAAETFGRIKTSFGQCPSHESEIVADKTEANGGIKEQRTDSLYSV